MADRAFGVNVLIQALQTCCLAALELVAGALVLLCLFDFLLREVKVGK